MSNIAMTYDKREKKYEHEPRILRFCNLRSIFKIPIITSFAFSPFAVRVFPSPSNRKMRLRLRVRVHTFCLIKLY